MPFCSSLAHKFAKGPLKLERSAKFFQIQMWESLGNSYVHKALHLGFLVILWWSTIMYYHEIKLCFSWLLISRTVRRVGRVRRARRVRGSGGQGGPGGSEGSGGSGGPGGPGGPGESGGSGGSGGSKGSGGSGGPGESGGSGGSGG